MSKVTITNGMNEDSRREDFNSKKYPYHFTYKELIELKTNLDMFIEEYEDFIEKEYLTFLLTLQAKLLCYTWIAIDREYK